MPTAQEGTLFPYTDAKESVNSQVQHSHWCLKLPPVCHKRPPINRISSADSES